MAPWVIAWRVKRAAMRAAVVPFGLMFALYLFEGLVEEIAARIVGAISMQLARDASLTLEEALYTAIDGLLIASLLEMLLSGRKLADSLPPFIPGKRAFRFALALFPIGLAASLLHLALRHGKGVALDWFATDPPQWAVGLSSLFFMLLNAPTLQWLVAGLAVAPLALRLLSLPALTDRGRAPPSSRPTLGLVGLLLAAVVLENLLEGGLAAVLMRGLEAGLGAIPGISGTAVAIILSGEVSVLVGWYVGTFVMTLMIATSVAVLLWRRRDSSDVSPDDSGPATVKAGP
ncbi:MAG: hypothetical protein GEV13_08620 [Rhodospirillales bacterium]|nr:hypothetical protein [Rhodospirillales bacterium]